MYSITGCDFCSALIERGNATLAPPPRAAAASASARSGRCPRPRRLIRKRRSSIVGSASCTSGRSARKNGARSFVAGFDSATSTSRSPRAARRFTNVVFALRSVGGSRPSARASAAFSSPIARAVAFAFDTRSARSSRRSAIAPTTVAVSTMKSSNCSSSRTSSRVRRRGRGQRRVEVLGGLVGLLRLAVVLGRAALDDLLEPLARLRVERVEELVEVHRRGGVVGVDLAAVVDLVGVVGARGERHVAARDARERAHADDGVGALVQRLEAPSRAPSRPRPGRRRSARSR